MRSGLLDKLIQQPGICRLDANTLNDFIQQPGATVLFCSGDPQQRPESHDLAVILPELQAAFAGQFAVGVVDANIELEVQARYGFTQWPTLVFLRQGEYVGHISRLLDWSDYLREIAGLLQAGVSRPPSIGVPLVSESL